jgi:hypothetical protein
MGKEIVRPSKLTIAVGTIGLVSCAAHKGLLA